MIFYGHKVAVFMVLAVMLLSYQGVLAQELEEEQDIILEGNSCALARPAKTSCAVAPTSFLQDLPHQVLWPEKEGFPILTTLHGLEKFRVRGEKFRKNVEQARFAAAQQRIRLGQSVKDKAYLAKMKSYRTGLKRYKTYCAHYKQSLHAFLKKNPKLKPVQPRPALTLAKRRRLADEENREFPFFPDS